MSTQRPSWWLSCSLPRVYTPPSLGASSLSECMNCTRLSDMSERLTTLEAKVRRPGELAGEAAAGTHRVWLGKRQPQGAQQA